MIRTEDLVRKALLKIKRRRKEDVVNSVFKVIQDDEELHQDYLDILADAYPSGIRAFNQSISRYVKTITGGKSLNEGNPCHGHTLARTYTKLHW